MEQVNPGRQDAAPPAEPLWTGTITFTYERKDGGIDPAKTSSEYRENWRQGWQLGAAGPQDQTGPGVRCTWSVHKTFFSHRIVVGADGMSSWQKQYGEGGGTTRPSSGSH